MSLTLPSHRIGAGLVWVTGWLLVFVATDFAPSALTFVLLVAGSGLATGAIISRWWAVFLPLGVVPIFALPAAYDEGGEPNYGIGLLVALAFVVVAIPSVAAGVAAGRRLLGS